MENFEEDVQYFVELILNNIKTVKEKKRCKKQTIFNCINVRLDGKEVIVYNEEKDIVYNLYTEDIKNYRNSESLTWGIVQHLALSYIDKLDKYNRREITFDEFIEKRKKTPKVVRDIIKQKNNISEQLKLLRSNRNLIEVQEFIDNMYKDEKLSCYMRYLIDRYYYNKNNLIRPEKNDLEKEFKLLLRWD